ncbi:hypothetical protein HOA56_08645 [archaeon]|nr:hypothetical protein [archaeon]MBT4647095.1 hypothetical protein [archaeon]MBT6822478.1 hypothetical protein [archaeon]
MHWIDVTNLIKYPILAGSHIIMMFVFVYFFGILIFQLDISALIMIVISSIIYTIYLKFYVFPKKMKRNLFFCYLSVLFVTIFILYMFRLQKFIDLFEIINGIFSMFIAAIIAFSIVIIIKGFFWIIIILMIYSNFFKFSLKRILMYIAIAIFGGLILFIFPSIGNMESGQYQPIIFMLQKTIFIFYGGLIWLHLQYLISEEDYAYDKKRKMKKKGKSEKILIYSDSIEINTK